MATGSVLVFDGDCGFCTTAARFAQRWVAGGRYAVAPWQRLDLDALGLTAQDCRDAAWFVEPAPDDATRRVRSPLRGHLAVAAALRCGHPWWRPVGRLVAARSLGGLAAAVYAWVAAHRDVLPGGTPACAMPRSA